MELGYSEIPSKHRLSFFLPEPAAIPIRSVLSTKLGRTPAFWLLVLTLALLLFASSAPSPLYIVYQAKWGFSAITLTGIFAVYALGLLGALVVTGSLSDHLGRRPSPSRRRMRRPGAWLSRSNRVMRGVPSDD
jgi:MFS family permease